MDNPQFRRFSHYPWKKAIKFSMYRKKEMERNSKNGLEESTPDI